MSDLQRSFAKAKLENLGPLEAQLLPQEEEEDEEEGLSEAPLRHDDGDSSSASSTSSMGTIKPLPSQNLFARPQGDRRAGRRTLEPLHWIDFFSQELHLPYDSPTANITYHAYYLAPSKGGPIFVAHHGAGSSGLSFAACAQELHKGLPGAGFLSIDARGHGETVVHSKDPNDSNPVLDLSLETLADDLINIVQIFQETIPGKELPGLVLIGHSLGGAVVTEVAKRGTLGNSVLAYAVLDVVEGSAMEALQSMQTYLATRPSGFPSLSAAIEWHTRTRTIRNTLSARISVPALVRRSSSPTQSYMWRTDLAATQPFWEDWFIGLSQKFLTAKGGKLLLLAGTDRLDKDLMIGQMQGKYQLQVFPEAGHFIHEDQPAKTASILIDFYRRNDRSKMVLPPKVGDLLKQKAQQETGAFAK